MSDNFVIDGSGTVYRLYDVGYEITLAQTHALLAPVAARPRSRRSEAGAIQTPTPPLPVELGRERLQLDGAEYGGAISASIYDFGVVALRLQVPADPQLPWNRRLQVEQPAVDQAMRTDRRQALGRRRDVDDRIARPRPRPRGVDMSRPQIDDRLAIDGDRHGRTDLAVPCEVLGKRVAHASET